MNKMASAVVVAVLVWAVPFLALSHESPHDKTDPHSMGKTKSGFEEGSGSSVLTNPGHEYKDGDSHGSSMKSGHRDEGSSGMTDPKTAPKQTDHEEGSSGMKSMKMKHKTEDSHDSH